MTSLVNLRTTLTHTIQIKIKDSPEAILIRSPENVHVGIESVGEGLAVGDLDLPDSFVGDVIQLLRSKGHRNVGR